MKYVWKCGHWVPRISRAVGQGPNIIRDTMDPLKHMGNGRTYDSKSAFRQASKALGLVEIGNETPKPRQTMIDRKSIRADIHTAIQQLEQGYRPQPVIPFEGGTVRRYDR